MPARYQQQDDYEVEVGTMDTENRDSENWLSAHTRLPLYWSLRSIAEALFR